MAPRSTSTPPPSVRAAPSLWPHTPPPRTPLAQPPLLPPTAEPTTATTTRAWHHYGCRGIPAMPPQHTAMLGGLIDRRPTVCGGAAPKAAAPRLHSSTCTHTTDVRPLRDWRPPFLEPTAPVIKAHVERQCPCPPAVAPLAFGAKTSQRPQPRPLCRRHAVGGAMHRHDRRCVAAHRACVGGTTVAGDLARRDCVRMCRRPRVCGRSVWCEPCARHAPHDVAHRARSREVFGGY